MTRITVSICLVLCSGLTLGCVERSTELTASEQQEVDRYRSQEAPEPEHELDISFENKVKLIGYDVSTETIEPGQRFTITWHWKCEQALDEGWLLFTHVADASGSDRLNSDGDSVIRRLYPPGRWRAGEYIKDEMTVTLGEDWNSNRASFLIGVWNGPHRLQITRGANDGDNRARALSLPVNAGETERPTPAVPTTRAVKTDAEIEIDGELDEEAWASAGTIARLVNPSSGGVAQPAASAKLLWDETNLYIGFDVTDDFLKSEYEEADDHLWEQDCVEVMIDPDGDGRNYFEMQVSPNGIVFDTRYEAARDPRPFGHLDWNSELNAAVSVRGEVNDDDEDEGYTVEMAIPWAAFAHGETPATPPTTNASWRMNLFVMDTRPGEEPQRMVAWSAPRRPDFHTLDRFGNVRFVEAGTAAAAPTGTPTGTPMLQLNPTIQDALRNPGNIAAPIKGGRPVPRPGQMVRPPPAAMGAQMVAAPYMAADMAADMAATME